LLRYENGQVTADSLLIDAPFAISSFGMDQDGELYICNYSGNIQRFVGSPLQPGGIPCDSIDAFQARCVSGGTIQARVVLFNSTEYAGEEVVISVDGVDYPLTVITNGTHSKAQVLLNGQTPGAHSVALESPQGCFNPINVVCATGSEKGDTWDWDSWGSGGAWTKDPGVDGPARTALLGSYPNPANPSTVIRYALAQDRHVNLEVFNTLGQRVATLVSEYQESGEHAATFDGRGVSSGVYFYRLSVGEVVEMRKLLLVK
jgi:hypothetical protein